MCAVPDGSSSSTQVVHRSRPRFLLVVLVVIVVGAVGGIAVASSRTEQWNRDLESALSSAERRIGRLEDELFLLRRGPTGDAPAIDATRSLSLPLPDSEFLTNGVLTLVAVTSDGSMSVLLTGDEGLALLKYRIVRGACSHGGRLARSDLSVSLPDPRGALRMATNELSVEDPGEGGYWIEALAGEVSLGMVQDPARDPRMLAAGSDPCVPATTP